MIGCVDDRVEHYARVDVERSNDGWMGMAEGDSHVGNTPLARASTHALLRPLVSGFPCLAPINPSEQSKRERSQCECLRRDTSTHHKLLTGAIVRLRHGEKTHRQETNGGDETNGDEWLFLCFTPQSACESLLLWWYKYNILWCIRSR